MVGSSEAERIARAALKRVRRIIRDALATLDVRCEGGIEAEVTRLAQAWHGPGTPDPDEVRAMTAPHRAMRAEADARDAVLEALRGEARARGAAHPERMPIPPLSVRRAWEGGDHEPGLDRVDAFLASEVARGLGDRTVAGVADMVATGHPKALQVLESVTAHLAGPAVVRARILFSHDPATFVRAGHLAGAVGSMTEEARIRQAACDRASEAGRKGSRVLARLTYAEARSRLDASDAEMRAWIASGVLGVSRPRGRDGAGVGGTTFDATLIAAAAAQVATWRRDAPGTARRASRGTTEDAARRAEQRRRASLAREAGLVPLPEGLRVDGLTLSSPDVPFRVAPVLATTPWPATVRTVVRSGAPVAPRTRVTAARRLREHVADAAAEVQRRLDAMVGEGVALAAELAPPRDAAGRATLARHVEEALARTTLSERLRTVDEAFRGEVLDAFVAAATAMLMGDARATLRDRTGLSDYPALFPLARAAGRRLVLHVGPTNSGKTHDAVADLLLAGSGAYLAPLRLMALETFDRMNAAGVPTTMATGEETLDVPGARHVSSTIEMVRTDVAYDVAVIDEAQLVQDRDRGWAWTQAVLGVAARVVHVTGSPDAVPYVARMAALTGETLEVVRHERKTPLSALAEPVAAVAPGDAVVAFSRAEVMRLRQVLGGSHRVATVYGALSPEVRRAEARRFRSGQATVLVATDAIAMGLNLPIRRVLFSSLHKYDGVTRRPLTPSEIRQIAGRAGRYGMGEEGHAGLLSPGLGGHPERAGQVSEALSGSPPPPGDLRLPVMPPWRAVAAVAAELGTEDLTRVLRHVAEVVLGSDPVLRSADLSTVTDVADLVASSGLPLRDRFGYLGCPVDVRDAPTREALRSWSREHAREGRVAPPCCGVVAVPEADEVLERCEAASKLLSAYMWLGRRWPATYVGVDAARAERVRVDALIEGALARKVLCRHCHGCGRLIDPRRLGRECESCAGGPRRLDGPRPR